MQSLTHNNKTMTPEEQLINDILVLEERKAHCPEWQEHEKLEQRQLKAVSEYAKVQAVNFAGQLSMIDVEFIKKRGYPEIESQYDKFKRQQ